MFETLHILGAEPPAPGLENLGTVRLDDPTPTPSNPNNAPPTRFGAIKIPMRPNPDNSCITIIEVPNDDNTNDYIVYIFGGIRYDSSYYAELAMLLATAPASSTIEIYISSPGGSLAAGAIIANAISSSAAQVTTIACGMVASAAALIWSYGKVRKVCDGAVLLFHMSSHMDWGNSEKIRIEADNVVRYVKEVAIDPIRAQGLLTEEEASILVDNRKDILIDAATMRQRLETAHA